MTDPYHYQTLVKDRFVQGHDLVVQAPTGAGKTRAALEPGIIGIHSQPGIHPPRIVYGIPMRVLARSFLDEYGKIATEQHWDYHAYPTIQTGENPEDPLFESRLIFATVDQMLASFLNIPYGIPRRLANINTGAMIGSYLIFDEFHLYPRNEMMLTVLAMLRMLKGVSRFVLMSATFSPVFLQCIAQELDAKAICDKPGTPILEGSFRDVKPVTSRERTFHAEDGSMTAAAVLELMGESNQCIAICNTVDRAQALYRSVQQGDPEIECRLLHSQFYRGDRARIEEFVTQRFRERGNKKTILVATQVIEVGLDITSDVLITECAPAASLIQRAGRCARREGEHGRVHVFQPCDEEGEVNYAPYLDEGLANVCQKTWDALTSSEFDDQVIGFPEEQRLVELAHSEADAAFIDGLSNKIEMRIDEVTKCMAQRDPGALGKLIRQQVRFPLYIHPDPNHDERLTEKPWQREAFSLSKGQIARLFETSAAAEGEFILCGGREDQEDQAEGYTRTQYIWDRLTSASEVYGRYFHFAAHPAAVRYSKDVGLELQPSDEVDTEALRESRIVKEPIWDRPAYHAEHYHEHIKGLYQAYTLPFTEGNHTYLGLRSEVQYPLRQLCMGLAVDADVAERLLRLTLALHDVGKLNQRWQAWARSWQARRAAGGYPLTIPLDESCLYAHTDYDSNDPLQREMQRALKPRGPHAVEGAQACIDVIRAATGHDEFWEAVILSAIMRHHTPDAADCGAFVLSKADSEAVAWALEICGFGEEAAAWISMIANSFKQSSRDLKHATQDTTPNFASYHGAIMYLLFVRVLRLADQRSSRYRQLYQENLFT